MLKLSEIKLVDATAKDIARAYNYSMKKSPETAKLLTGQLNLLGPMKEKHVIDLYPKDTFTKEGRLNPLARCDFAIETRDSFKHPKRDLKDLNMIDFANAIIQRITKR